MSEKSKFLVCETLKKHEYYYVSAESAEEAVIKHKESHVDSEYYDAEYGDTLNVEIIEESKSDSYSVT